MSEQVTIMSVQGYVKKYGVDKIGKGEDRWAVKRQMLDQMRREILDLGVLKIGPHIFSDNYEGTDEERQKLENILKNAQKKWMSLYRVFAQYRETNGLLEPYDLMNYLDERMHQAADIPKNEREA